MTRKSYKPPERSTEKVNKLNPNDVIDSIRSTNKVLIQHNAELIKRIEKLEMLLSDAISAFNKALLITKTNRTENKRRVKS